MILILFGVAGSGKTTIGRLLARELAWTFCDADALHSKSNVEKMRRGIALNEADRWPWLEKLRELLKHTIARQENLVLACSALKQEYRDYLYIEDEVKRIPGVGNALTFGQLQFAMNLDLDPDRMAQLGVTVTDVANAVREQNNTNPA